jgi:anti-anti-sigma factor
MLNINSEKNGRELIFKLEGRLDTSTAPDFGARVNEEVVDIDKLVIDLKDLEYVSSAGLRVILSALKMMKGGEMVVCNVNSDIMEVFDMTGFSDLLTIE